MSPPDRAGFTAELAEWAVGFEPRPDDLALADRALLDTVAVGLAAREEPILEIARSLSEEARWAVAFHILDFDDLHPPSTTHISSICVPVALSLGAGPRSYLVAAAVMARIGQALGWQHYAAGWHATTTAGTIAAAAGAAVALGLDAGGVSRAMALAVPAAGGVQRAFGTDAKSLQVGFAVAAGVRATQLAVAGASADPRAVDDWLRLMGGSDDNVVFSEVAIPGGLAVKLYPCCYALQRPIGAAAALRADRMQTPICGIRVRAPRATVQPLIHSRPRTGLEAKFSLEYAIATTLLDGPPGLTAFRDDAVNRPEVTRLIDLVEVDLTDSGDHLLAGEAEVTIQTAEGQRTAAVTFPPGSPQNPPSTEELGRKLADCLTGTPVLPQDITWAAAPRLLRAHLPPAFREALRIH